MKAMTLALANVVVTPRTPCAELSCERATELVHACHEKQVWSLTQLYSVEFSQSRIGEKKVCFQQTHNQGLHQLFLTVSWDLRA